MYRTIIFIIFIVLFLTVLEQILREKNDDIKFMDYQYTDRLRGLAAVLVVISHVSGLTGTRVATPLGGVGVALFLICSAYGMYHSYIKKGMKGFWRGKIKRVLLPYWITVILYYMINFNQGTNIKTIVRNLLLINPIPYLWFVQYLMMFNMIFWIVFSFVPENLRISVIFAIGLGALLFIKNDMYAEQGLSFATGLILGKYQKSNEIEKDKALKMGSAFLAVSIMFLGVKQFPEVRSSFFAIVNIVQMFIKLFGACGILFITQKTGAIVWNKAFVSIGKCSYELYIVHTLLIPYLVNNGVGILAMLIYLVGCEVGVAILHWVLQKFDVVRIKAT